MKKIFVFILAVTVFAACSKQSPSSDDLFQEQLSRRSGGVEDNPNGGGGLNTTTIPPVILAAFNSKFPGVTRIEWKLLANGNYKVEFYKGTVKWQVIYSPTGTILKMESR
jgi:hypothetical protein